MTKDGLIFKSTSAGDDYLKGIVFTANVYLDYINQMKELMATDPQNAARYQREIEATYLVMKEIKFRL